MSLVLSVERLRKVYPGKKQHIAVDNISFSLKKGEILGLLGANGSGKTTTIQMLLGTLSPTSGDIAYFGKDFRAHRSEVLNSISFASAYASLPWLLTVCENLEIFGRLYGFNPKESAKRFDPLLERFGILDKKKSRVSALSAGQITRLMLVKSFFIEPKIALLDEPTASLDPDMAKEICEFILEQREKIGVSILFTSHKMEEVAMLCDRAIFLKEGKIIADDVPKKLAASISTFKLKLVIIDGMERVTILAQNGGLSFKIEHRAIELSIGGDAIPPFLTALAHAKVTYAHIQIEEPSLEDYFLHIARKS